MGRTFTFNYDVNGKLNRVSDDTTRTLTFSHTSDDLTSVTNALGKATTFTYTSDGLMTTKNLPEGNTPFTQTFDSESRAITQTDSNGNINTLEYLDSDTVLTDPLGKTMKHTHSTNGELTDNQDKDGNTFDMGYDDTGRRDEIIDRLGDITSFTYHEPSGNISSIANADSTTTDSNYTERALDSGIKLFDLTEIAFPDGTTNTMVYDDNGNMTSFTDQAGNISTFTYNDRGQLLAAANPAGGIATNRYNLDGTLASQTDPSGNTISIEYDNLKRPVTITQADNTQEL